MKRAAILVVAVILMLALVSGAVFAAGGFKKATTSVLDEGLLIAYGSGSTGGNPNVYSGRIWEGYGKIKSIGKGKSTVRIIACWDWGRGAPAGESNQIHTGDHKGGPIVTTPQEFIDTTARETPFDGPFTATATVTITDQKGDVVVGNIVSGSVFELEVFGSLTSINEWLISFVVDSEASTGKFSGATGKGVYRMIWESGDYGTPESKYQDAGLVDPDRFLEQEIFLHLNKYKAPKPPKPPK